jgi:ABC-type transport system involved in cytochrome c biogenesis permease subunit
LAALLVPLVLLAYFVGVFLAVLATLHRSTLARRASLTALAVAWALQLFTIVHHGRAVGYFPISNQVEFLLVLAWAILTLHLVVAWRSNVPVIGILLPPLAALMVVPSLWLSTRHGSMPYPGKQWLFVLHTTVATAGIAALCLAFGMSLLYLAQDRALKSKRAPTVLQRLPSLAACDRIGHIAILAGFPLLTLGIVTGAIWSFDTHGKFFNPAVKQIFPLLAWAVYAALLLFRGARGQGGRPAAYLTIAGFTLALLTVFGMSL